MNQPHIMAPERQHGDALDDRAGALGRAADEGLGVLLDPAGGLADPLVARVDLDVDRQRVVLDEVDDLVDAGVELSRELFPLAGHGDDDVRHEAADDEEAGQDGRRRGQGAVHDPGVEVGHRVEHRGEDQREEHRHEDDQHLRDRPEHQGDPGHQDDQAPRPAGGGAQPGRRGGLGRRRVAVPCGVCVWCGVRHRVSLPHGRALCPVLCAVL
jgi:hypothetical protein